MWWTILYTICWHFALGYSFYKSCSDDPSSIPLIESIYHDPSSISLIESSLDDPSSISLIIVIVIIVIEGGCDAMTKVTLWGSSRGIKEVGKFTSLEWRNQAEFSKITINSLSQEIAALSLSYFLLFQFHQKKFGRDPLLHRGFPVRKDLKILCPFQIFLFLLLWLVILFRGDCGP